MSENKNKNENVQAEINTEGKTNNPEPTGIPAASLPEPVVNSPDLISKANEAAERMETANNQMEANLKRQESLMVEKTLSGQTTAGEPQGLTEEDKAIEEAEKLLVGTGYEGLLRKQKKS